MRCRVCDGEGAAPFQTVDGRGYLRCPDCLATFLDTAQLPSEQEERAHYLLHENEVDDPDYRSFLNTLAVPLLAVLRPGQLGLDYGCGPGPALAHMLRAAGHTVHLYDPYFYPDEVTLAQDYDFICCSETVEHFHDPAREFARLAGLLRPGGVLAIMTRFMVEDGRFAQWHYRRDPTHVVFYREETFRFLARRHGWSCTFPGRDVVLLTRPAATSPRTA